MRISRQKTATMSNIEVKIVKCSFPLMKNVNKEKKNRIIEADTGIWKIDKFLLKSF
jgi:hypothetical protein